MRSFSDTAAVIDGLRRRVREVIDSHRRTEDSCRVVPTRWPEVDGVLARGGLARGAIHEWIGPGDTSLPRARSPRWRPPLLILGHVAHAAAVERDAVLPVVWVGRRVWPLPASLLRRERGRDLLGRSLFVDPGNPGDHVWAIDTALRCPGLVVVADASRMDMASSRRIQLAAEAGGGIGLLARPAWERGELSAAETRWIVSRVEARNAGEPAQRWRITLARCKAAHRADTHGTAVVLECSCAGLVALPPDPAGRPGAAAAAS